MSFKTSIKYKVFLFQCLIFFCNYSYSQNKFIQELSKAECDSCECINCKWTYDKCIVDLNLDSIKLRNNTYYPFKFFQRYEIEDTAISGYLRFDKNKLWFLDVYYNDSMLRSLDPSTTAGVYGDVSKEVLFLDFATDIGDYWHVYNIGILHNHIIKLKNKYYNREIEDTVYHFSCRLKPKSFTSGLSHKIYNKLKSIYASPNFGIIKIIFKSEENNVYECKLREF